MSHDQCCLFHTLIYPRIIDLFCIVTFYDDDYDDDADDDDDDHVDDEMIPQRFPCVSITPSRLLCVLMYGIALFLAHMLITGCKSISCQQYRLFHGFENTEIIVNFGSYAIYARGQWHCMIVMYGLSYSFGDQSIWN